MSAASPFVGLEAAALERPLNGQVLDASGLRDHAFGRRSTLFWGMVLLGCIEGMVFAIMFASYFYVRDQFSVWPPEERLRLAPGIASTLVAVASGFTMWKVRVSAVEERLAPMRSWLVVTTVLGCAWLGLRAWEIHALTFSYDANVYASIVWTTFGFHTVDAVAGVFECALMLVLLFKGPLEKKHFEDNDASAVLWFFLVGVWIPFSILFYADGFVR